MQPRLFVAAAATLMLLAGTQRATAETVSLAYDGNTNFPSVSIEFTNNGQTTHIGTATPGPYYWHEVNAPINSQFPALTATFCVELGQDIFPGNTYQFSTTTPAAAFGDEKAGLITALYNQHYDPAWATAAFRDKFGGDPGLVASTAFQLALWEILGDGANGVPGLDLTGGNFKAPGLNENDPTNPTGLAQQWVSNLNPTNGPLTGQLAGYQLTVLANPYNQDQIIPLPPGPPPHVIPTPPGAILAGIGFVTLLGRARWLRRAKASV